MATGLDICGKFREIVNTDHNLSMPVATIKALSETLKQSQGKLLLAPFIESWLAKDSPLSCSLNGVWFH